MLLLGDAGYVAQEDYGGCWDVLLLRRTFTPFLTFFGVGAIFSVAGFSGEVSVCLCVRVVSAMRLDRC